MAKIFSRKKNVPVKKDISERELEELKTAFTLLDKNEDGKVSTKELHTMLCRIGIEIDDEWLEELLKGASYTGNELINEDEFFHWVKRIQNLRPDEVDDDIQKDLMAAFKVFDLDNNGYITRDELKTAMETIGEAVTEQQLTELITIADTDKDGRINYEEFIALLL